MTVYNPENNMPLKHYAFDSKTRGRYIVIALENETDRNTCSVVDLDMLDSQISSELLAYVNSDICQHSCEIWKELDKKMFMDYPKTTMLNVLKAKHLIKVLPSDQVIIQLPNEENRTAKEVMEGVRQYTKATMGGSRGFTPTSNSEQTVEVSNVESKNADDIKELKEQMASLTSMMAELVKATKESKKK